MRRAISKSTFHLIAMAWLVWLLPGPLTEPATAQRVNPFAGQWCLDQNAGLAAKSRSALPGTFAIEAAGPSQVTRITGAFNAEVHANLAGMAMNGPNELLLLTRTGGYHVYKLTDKDPVQLVYVIETADKPAAKEDFYLFNRC